MLVNVPARAVFFVEDELSSRKRSERLFLRMFVLIVSRRERIVELLRAKVCW